jgi:hypothetical protein
MIVGESEERCEAVRYLIGPRLGFQIPNGAHPFACQTRLDGEPILKMADSNV